MKKLLLLILTMNIAISCGGNVIEEPDVDNFGYQFYPLSVGNEWVYQVDSSRIQGKNVIHTSSQIKERIKELISEDSSSKVYSVERSFRKSIQDNWRITDIWTVEIDAGRIIRNEENQKFIKLIFPNIKSTSWDGNVFFDDNRPFYSGADFIDKFYLDWKYKITATDTTLQLGSTIVQDAIEITHVNENDIAGINNRLSIEYFAPNVGLVKKDLKAFYSGTGIGFASDSLWLAKGDKGLIFTQELISYIIK
ncbi:MAG: putative transcriptional regulator [Saprospiraceae bacterium]|jgi:predicted transcriptional regulator